MFVFGGKGKFGTQKKDIVSRYEAYHMDLLCENSQIVINSTKTKLL